MSDKKLRELQRQWRESGLFSDFRKWSQAAARSRHMSGDIYELSEYIAKKLAVYVNKWDHPTPNRWTTNVPKSAYGAGENMYVPTTLAFQHKERGRWTYTGWGIGVALGFPEMWYSISTDRRGAANPQNKQIIVLISKFLNSLGFMPRDSRFEDL